MQDISKWNVSNVTDMSSMFTWTESFNQPIGDWDVSKITNMTCLFYHAEKFNQDISRWAISTGPHKDRMFDRCPLARKIKPGKYKEKATERRG